MPMGVPPKWIDVAGTQTRYFDHGHGEPILFITGGHYGNSMGASTVDTWDRNFGVLGTQYRVLAIDKLGHGFTDNPRNDDYTMAALNRHLVGFVEALDLQNLHLVGQSAGSLSVVMLARDCLPRVSSCTLVNSSTLSPGVSLNEVTAAGCPYPPFSREGQRFLFERCAFSPVSVTDEFVDAGHDVMQLPKYRDCARAMDEGLRVRLFRPELGRAKNDALQWITEGGLGRPTQVVWGYNDHSAKLDRGVALYQMIAAHERQAYLHVVNEAGHHPYREHPEQFNEMMLGFLQTLN
jgi:2-hydroxy-6-oxonona-2,4-dienedioate hydrolase